MIVAFHNYAPFLKIWERDFQLLKRKEGSRNTNTTRFEEGSGDNSGYDDPVDMKGVFEFVTEAEVKRYPDFVLEHGDMKVIISNPSTNGTTPQIRDRIIHEGKTLYVDRVRKEVHYGNYWVFYLKEREARD